MGRGTTYYTIYHTGGTTHILAYGEYDAIEQFRKQYPNYAIKKVVEVCIDSKDKPSAISRRACNS